MAKVAGGYAKSLVEDQSLQAFVARRLCILCILPLGAPLRLTIQL